MLCIVRASVETVRAGMLSIGCSISEGLTVTDNRIWYLASYREIIEL